VQVEQAVAVEEAVIQLAQPDLVIQAAAAAAGDTSKRLALPMQAVMVVQD
jgi:hypothetical protein